MRQTKNTIIIVFLLDLRLYWIFNIISKIISYFSLNILTLYSFNMSTTALTKTVPFTCMGRQDKNLHLGYSFWKYVKKLCSIISFEISGLVALWSCHFMLTRKLYVKKESQRKIRFELENPTNCLFKVCFFWIS